MVHAASAVAFAVIALNAATTMAMPSYDVNDLVERDFESSEVEAREFYEEFEERDYIDEFEARELLETLEARDFEDLDAREVEEVFQYLRSVASPATTTSTVTTTVTKTATHTPSPTACTKKELRNKKKAEKAEKKKAAKAKKEAKKAAAKARKEAKKAAKKAKHDKHHNGTKAAATTTTSTSSTSTSTSTSSSTSTPTPTPHGHGHHRHSHLSSEERHGYRHGHHDSEDRYEQHHFNALYRHSHHGDGHRHHHDEAKITGAPHDLEKAVAPTVTHTVTVETTTTAAQPACTKASKGHKHHRRSFEDFAEEVFAREYAFDELD